MRKALTGAALVAALTLALAGPVIADAQTPGGSQPGASPAPMTTPIPAVSIAPDGSLRYVYGGRTEPLLTCRPLFVCDVIMEPGESVINIAIGDSVRWVIASAQSGPGGNTPHVFVKPTELNLATNLMVTTTKRVYYLRLASANYSNATRISYAYPDEETAAVLAKIAADREVEEEKASEIPLQPRNGLDYNYRIEGAHQIIPQRVYNDGVHSYIEYATLPTDLPVVYSVAPDGANQIVNYRLRGTTFIVDGIPSGFDLVLNGGTGKHGHGELRSYIRHK